MSRHILQSFVLNSWEWPDTVKLAPGKVSPSYTLLEIDLMERENSTIQNNKGDKSSRLESPDRAFNLRIEEKPACLLLNRLSNQPKIHWLELFHFSFSFQSFGFSLSEGYGVLGYLWVDLGDFLLLL